MVDVVISGTGLYVPPGTVSNDELVDAFNRYVEQFNADNADAIAKGDVEALQPSSSAFIEKASGIRSRHMIDAEGVKDTDRMMAQLPEGAHGDEDTPGIQAAMAIKAAEQALEQAGLKAEDIDNVICSNSSPQRFFPAIGIEVQHFMGTKGTASDMVMGCSSATFGMIAGVNAIKAGTCDRVLMVNPEIFTTMTDFRNRDSHFIFGDIAVAVVLERADLATASQVWKVLDTESETKFSSNIRSHYGSLTRLEPDSLDRKDMFFMQQGRKVFKELLPLVTDFVERQLGDAGVGVDDLSRMWLHQANRNMNNFAAKKLLGRDPTFEDAPIVLDEYGNTAGAGSIAAFHKHRDDLESGDKGLICSFGAGYSIGSLLVEKA